MTPLDFDSTTTTSETDLRLGCLRSVLGRLGLDGYLVPSADEHLSSYLPEATRRRAWLSGFDGSAGDLLIGLDRCWLFVDSRYHEQADRDVDRSLIEPVKLGIEGQPSLIETLQDQGRLASGRGEAFRLGLDPFTVSVETWQSFERKLLPLGVELVIVEGNLVDQVRHELETDPPGLWSEQPVYAVAESVVGQSIAEKLTRVRRSMVAHGAQVLPLTRQAKQLATLGDRLVCF